MSPSNFASNPRLAISDLERRADYRPQLDGLRALAVAAVAWSHWERPYQFGIPFGAGVHLFYVLSGFLITTILLDVRDQTSRVSGVRAFYIRRALRIFPAFYLTLALAWLADVPPVRDTLLWHATYLSNVFIFTTEQWPGSISHLWSLAVEEQFYLLWPWLIVFAPRRWLVPAVVAAIASAPLFRWWLAAEGYRENMLAVLTPGCLDSLGAGALLALATVYGPRSTVDGPRSTVSGLRSTVSGLRSTVSGLRSTVNGLRSMVGVAFAALAAILFVEASVGAIPVPLLAIKQLLQSIVFGWLVLGAADGFGGVAGRVLSAAPVVYIGKISYGIYLVHGFAGEILLGVGIYSRDIPEPFRFLVLSGLTTAIAALSWHLMEAPINHLKRHFPYAKRRVESRSREPWIMHA